MLVATSGPPLSSWPIVLLLASALARSAPVLAQPTRPAMPVAAPSASQAGVTAESVLARWAHAVGGVMRLREIENVYLKSAHTGTGGAGDVEEWLTRAAQRRQVSQLEFDRVLVTCDGTSGWQLRESRARKLDPGEVAGQRSAALLGTLAHLLPGHPGVHVELLGDDDSGRCHALALRIGGERASVVHVDKTTELPVRSILLFSSGPFTFEHLDWKEFDGVRLPARTRISSTDGYEAVEVLKEVRWNVALDPSLFGRPPDRAKTHRFVGSETAPDIPFATDGGHIFVQGRVQGSQPVWLTIDTGASGSLLDADFARSVGLELIGQGTATGPAGPVAAAFVRAARVTLPGVELTVANAQAIPMEFLWRGCGRKVMAILGYDFFERFVVEIDYAARVLRLRDPDDFEYAGKGETIPITLRSLQPYVRARLDAGQGKRLDGEFVVDLGSGATLMLAHDFDAQHGILASADAPLRESGGGVGGEFELSVARLGALSLGSFTIPKPVTLFPRGRITEPGTAGNIGAGLLGRFRVIIDYARERIILEPTARMAEHDEYDMSGLAFAGTGPDFETILVRRVSIGSPAADAGIRRDDILERVDGRPAAELGLAGVRELLRRDGEEVELDVRTAGAVRTLKLRLRRRI